MHRTALPRVAHTGPSALGCRRAQDGAAVLLHPPPRHAAAMRLAPHRKQRRGTRGARHRPTRAAHQARCGGLRARRPIPPTAVAPHACCLHAPLAAPHTCALLARWARRRRTHASVPRRRPTPASSAASPGRSARCGHTRRPNLLLGDDNVLAPLIADLVQDACYHGAAAFATPWRSLVRA